MKKFLPAFVLAALFSSAAFALTIPEKPGRYVNDYAGMLTPGASARIEESLSRFEKDTSNQVFAAIFESLDGESLEDFSNRLFEKWKVGQKGKDNGVLLVIFKADRKVRIEVGYGLEGALPDALAAQIIRNEIAPQFRAGDYDAGVERAVAAIVAATKNEYKAVPARAESSQSTVILCFLALSTFFSMPIVCYILVILLCVWTLGAGPGLLLGVFIDVLLGFLRTALFSGYPGTTYSRRGPGAFGGLGYGGGFGGGGSGGGFGGGGGGSSGGGGASGSW